MSKNGKKPLTHRRTRSRNATASPRRLPATKSKRWVLGRYIVVDPKICHGKPTFRGTRIMVADVLEMVASGVPSNVAQDPHTIGTVATPYCPSGIP